MKKLGVLSSDELYDIKQATLEVLETIGLKVWLDEALELLRKAGAEVDSRLRVVKFPSSLVEETRRNTALYEIMR